MAQQAITKFIPPRNALSGLLPDTARYKARFDVKSASSDRVYRCSYDAAPGSRYFVCSCPGYIRHGHCKHLSASGLAGRSDKERALAQGKQYGWIQ